MMFNPTIRLVAALLSLLVLVQGCAVNPATGQREISFVSEAQEIRMGQQADPAATAQFGGLYPDNDLQAYVTGLGESIAAVSERPELDWSFKLVDHELINAFAIPGGYIYITRGITGNDPHRTLTLLTSGDVDVEHPLQALSPGHGGMALGWCSFICVGSGPSALAAPAPSGRRKVEQLETSKRIS